MFLLVLAAPDGPDVAGAVERAAGPPRRAARLAHRARQPGAVRRERRARSWPSATDRRRRRCCSSTSTTSRPSTTASATRPATSCSSPSPTGSSDCVRGQRHRGPPRRRRVRRAARERRRPAGRHRRRPASAGAPSQSPDRGRRPRGPHLGQRRHRRRAAGRHRAAPTMLLQAADVAMYRAKSKGKGRFEFFEHEHAPRGRRPPRPQDATCRSPSSAASSSCYYQPIVDLDDEQVHGVEALLRWHHPTRGMVTPDRVHPARRGDRAHRADRPLGAARGVPPGDAVAAARTPTRRPEDDQREPVGAPAARPAPARGRRSTRCRQSGPRPPVPHARDHREHADRGDRPRPRGPSTS